MLLEDYKSDIQHRKLAVKMAEAIISGMVKERKNLILHEEYFILDITKEMHKVDENFANYNFAILFSDGSKDGSYACSQATVGTGKECIFFKIPFSLGKPRDLVGEYIFTKHKRKSMKEYQEMLDSGMDEHTALQKLMQIGLKYVMDDFLKLAKKSFFEGSELFATLVHECIHAIDKMRYSPTYKHKEQHTDSDEGITDYYNRADEQHAFLQQTLYIVDDYVKEKILDRESFKDFNQFYNIFVDNFYRGNYSKLLPSNKRKIQKKLYVYYKHIFATPKYQSYANPKD